MGTKRPLDEDLQEFIKYPKHLENGNKPDSFKEDKHSFEGFRNVEISGEGGTNFFHTDVDHEKVNVVPDFDKTFETSASLPLVNGISGCEDVSGTALTFCTNVFPEFFEFNMPRQQLIHYDDTYSSLLNCSPRKEVPVGPEHQANVPEFDSDSARNYVSDPGNESLMGRCVFSNQEGETVMTQTDFECLDGGSIRCVQQHVNEARQKLKESLGLEKFFNLGFNNMGEEVACNWTEEEQFFQDVVYSNPLSHGKKFWEELSIAFPSRTKRELVSYYFNVFILRRRAIQNRSQLLAIDSDDDEWWGTKKGPPGVVIEDQDVVVVGPFVNRGDHDSEFEDGGRDDNCGAEEGENQINESSLSDIHDAKVTSENEQEKPVNVNKQEGNSGGLRSESYLHWEPPYSSMGSTKGVDLLPTCSMIEEIFGSSKTGTSS